MCKTHNQILAAAAQLHHAQIAQRIEQRMGEKCSPDSVQKWLSGTSGVPLEKLGALLYALDLKVVPESDVVVPVDEHAALMLFARKGLGQ